MKKALMRIRGELGWQGMAGILLLGAAAIFLKLALDPLEREAEFMRGRLEVVQFRGITQTQAIRLNNQQKELALFFESLPAEQDVTDILAKIYLVAEGIGVELKQAEYHPEDKGKAWVEYKMNFPLQGEYGRIRFFVSRILADHPAMGLDQISFQRDKVSDPLVKAEIQMTLFLRH